MDLFLLQAVAVESAGRLTEQELLRVAHLGWSRYLLRFATTRHDNLLISVRPDQPRIHLLHRRGRVLEEPPDRFAALLDREIGGAVLTGLEVPPWDRIVEMRFRLPRGAGDAAERRLVVELFGRSANALLLDAAGIVLGYCRDIKSAFRAPVMGRMYEPPAERPEYEGLTPSSINLPVIRSRWPGSISFLKPLSPILARDLEIIASRDPGQVETRMGQILTCMRTGRWTPVVYSDRPLDGAVESVTPDRREPWIVPLPLLDPGQEGVPPHPTRFASPSEAASAALDLAERLRDLAAMSARHQATVRQEIRRLKTMTRKLEIDLEAARGCDHDRHLGEALLAGLRSARIEGHEAVVSDPRDPGGEPLRVEIDPSRSLQENAQARFRRYKKGKRGLTAITKRLDAVRSRLQEWEALLPIAEGAKTPEDIEALREGMARLGLVHAPRTRRDPPVRRSGETPARVRRHTSPDGLVIMVGRSGSENDALTFRVAAPEDFWLHVADHPGAHVVVRNPRRLKSLPERTLRQAAEIAAFYSGARGEGGVEVHFTQRKHVHKRKGMPSGQVVLRRFRSVRVAPRLPSPMAAGI